MALSNYDYGSLATTYDRIMNASKGSVQKKTQQAEIVANIVKKIEQIVGSFQHQIRMDSSHFAGKDHHLNSRSTNSVSSHFMPGEIPWHDHLGAQIDVDSSANNRFFNFFIKTGQHQGEASFRDDREKSKSISSSVAT